jgi:hypothetical protein
MNRAAARRHFQGGTTTTTTTFTLTLRYARYALAALHAVGFALTYN